MNNIHVEKFLHQAGLTKQGLSSKIISLTWETETGNMWCLHYLASITHYNQAESGKHYKQGMHTQLNHGKQMYTYSGGSII